MKIHKESHLDHDLKQKQLEYVLERFAERSSFFIETFELSEELGTVPCGLHGPLVGDAPLTEDETVMVHRGERTWQSRMVARPTRRTRTITVIAGPHDGEPCILYTVFGGPLTPQEPGDPNCKDVEASKKFWSEHALSL